MHGGTFRVFWDAVRGYRRDYCIGAAALLAVDLLDLLPPRFVGLLVDQIPKESPEFTPGMIAAGFLAAIVLQNLFRYPMRLYFRGTAARATAALRERYAAHLLRLSQEFYARRETGDLMSRATNDIEAVERALGFGLLLLLDTFYYLFTIPVAMFFLSPALTVYAFALMPLVPVLVYVIARRIDRTFEQVQNLFGELSSRAQQNAAGVHLLRAYGAETRQVELFRNAADRYVERSLSLARLEAAFWPLIHLCLAAGLFAVLFFGGRRALRGEISVGEFVSFTHYMVMLVWPLMTLGWTITMFQRGKASLRRIHEVLDLSPAVQDGPETAGPADGRGEARSSESPQPAGAERRASPRPSPVRGEIEFRNLTYRYPEAHENALENFSMKIGPGETVAVVGPIGSGKSTLIYLLSRLYDPPPGTVFLDGRDVRRYRLADLRRSLAVVLQEPFLFSATIRANIGGGTVEPAARAACLAQDAFPAGLDTMLGEQGINLSGGQKQRVALAAALHRDAPVLLLDDALSAVDAETEEKVLRNLRAARRGRTCLIVSHRMRTAREADRIVVLDGGSVVESGTHEELLRRDGRYAELVRQQSWEAVFHG